MTDNRKYKFLDRDHPFFAKTWVRGATVALPAGMAVLEFAMASPGFGILFAAAAGWALWELFLRP
ncbi:MAG: hypothetical protein FJX28_10415 [Alphaproteobacteria bacterium]|jgi:hypothetical protein|nr:hypothetical protein [Alphaproteobacteria bacterium]